MPPIILIFRSKSLGIASPNRHAAAEMIRTVVLVFGCGFLVGGCRTCQGEDTSVVSPAQRNQYVLLANDRVLSGIVTVRGRSIIIRRGNDSELTLKAEQITAVENDMLSLFRARMRSLRRSKRTPLSDALADARWCIDNGLPSQATEMLMRVYSVAPDHPVALQLESRLRRSAAENRDAPDSSDEVLPVSHSVERPASEFAGDEPSPAVNALTAHASLHSFTAKVQPILLLRCAKCHHERSEVPTDWNLVRPPGGALRVNQRGSVANLESTLRWCNLSRPESSELIVKALRDHRHGFTPNDSNDPGIQPPIREHEIVLIRTLVNWIASVANEPVARSTSIDHDEIPNESVKHRERATLNPIEPSDVAASLQRVPAIASESSDVSKTSDLSETQAASATVSLATRPRAQSAQPVRLPLVENPNDVEHFNRETRLLRQLGLGAGGNR